MPDIKSRPETILQNVDSARGTPMKDDLHRKKIERETSILGPIVAAIIFFIIVFVFFSFYVEDPPL